MPVAVDAVAAAAAVAVVVAQQDVRTAAPTACANRLFIALPAWDPYEREANGSPARRRARQNDGWRQQNWFVVRLPALKDAQLCTGHCDQFSDHRERVELPDTCAIRSFPPPWHACLRRFSAFEP